MSEEKLDVESSVGFIFAPTGEDIKPTPEEQEKLKKLWEWHETSQRSQIVLGEVEYSDC